MIRVLFALFILVGFFHFGIQAWRYATGKERWEFAKVLTYSVTLGIIAVLVLSVIVVLF